jgi:hypothetical protein
MLDSTLPPEAGSFPRALRLHLPPHQDVIARNIAAGIIELAVEGLDPDLPTESLDTVLAAYPSLAGGTSAAAAFHEVPESANKYYLTGRNQIVFNPRGRLFDLSILKPWIDEAPVLSWTINAHDAASHDERFRQLGSAPVRGDDETRGVFPRIGDAEAPHFLGLLWLQLLALSSLVRYDPAAWTAAIDPDSSTLAVPLEQACDRADELVADMLLRLLSAARR